METPEFNPNNSQEDTKMDVKAFLARLEDLSQDKDKIGSLIKNHGEGKKRENYRIENINEPVLIDNKIFLVSAEEKYTLRNPHDPYKVAIAGSNGGIFFVIKNDGKLIVSDPGGSIEVTLATIESGQSGNEGADAPVIKSATLGEDGVITFKQLVGHKTDDIYERRVDLKTLKFNGQDYKTFSKNL
jgi:hypothetical protein